MWVRNRILCEIEQHVTVELSCSVDITLVVIFGMNLSGEICRLVLVTQFLNTTKL